ncbi:unnamed protein product [Paramecium sonneborni]|uniref:Uncharacterized protein n=1 Tax=Paramecium sonneborni TaxID=65129 RepID=A0A8S1NFB2_9CILI|nr:unnamed protein product [Paramecium sonneborni]
MLRVFKAKTREYIKEAIEFNNLQFPWKFGGFPHEPKDGQLNGFTDWRRIINEEKLQELSTEYFQKINELQPLRLERIVEHSLMSQIYRELMRYKLQNHKHTLKFDIKCFDFGVYNTENIFRVGVHLGRQRNKPLEIRHFNQNINGHDFLCVWRKRPFVTDKATLSLFIDVSFKTQGTIMLLNQKKEIIYQNDQNNQEFHCMRLESEIMNCNFISAKNEQSNLRDMKRMDDNLHIIDVDHYLKGNNYINYIE